MLRILVDCWLLDCCQRQIDCENRRPVGGFTSSSSSSSLLCRNKILGVVLLRFALTASLLNQLKKTEGEKKRAYPIKWALTEEKFLTGGDCNQSKAVIDLVKKLYGKKNIAGPPKLLEQPPEEVWYQLDESLSPNARPTLKCHASDNAESFKWYKNGEELTIGGDIEWIRAGQSGTIQFVHPKRTHEGYYQCFVSNIFGTAVSNKVHLRLGGEAQHLRQLGSGV
ncbi:immunoglobulin domain protein [Dictyocaulus viviparus]|uniref:Immunoglobulin domain protein n=1 Tax=Dictyocaulus viviparus TaxID=29172 RepID=A0A0D8XV40_DICVI|nr:immunoglobulin domain protein [Dictyocaulus viviparus]